MRLSTASPEPTESAAGTATITVSSEPKAAEIVIDDEYVGNTPSTLSVDPGPHRVVITKKGFEPWDRKMRFRGGDNRTIHADLESRSGVRPGETAEASNQ